MPIICTDTCLETLFPLVDALNRSGVNHQCDRQTDGQNCDSYSVRRALKLDDTLYSTDFYHATACSK